MLQVEIMKGDIFDNIGLSPEEAARERMRANVLNAIIKEIERRHLTQKQVMEALGEYQAQVSNLMRGKIAKISLDRLVQYAASLGLTLNVTSRPTVATRVVLSRSPKGAAIPRAYKKKKAQQLHPEHARSTRSRPTLNGPVTKTVTPRQAHAS